jgi:hypothetical protein
MSADDAHVQGRPREINERSYATHLELEGKNRCKLLDGQLPFRHLDEDRQLTPWRIRYAHHSWTSAA